VPRANRTFRADTREPLSRRASEPDSATKLGARGGPGTSDPIPTKVLAHERRPFAPRGVQPPAGHSFCAEPSAASSSDFSDLIPFDDVPKRLPRSRRTGKKLHVSVLYRWTRRGSHGVKLKFLKIGATSYTKLSWLEMFFQAVTAASKGGDDGVDRLAHDRAHAEAEKALSLAGI
jgi:hypothetical protein